MPLLILLFFASVAWCGSIRLEQLTIWIYDYVPVPPQTLDKALVNSQRIFLKAGVETKWLKCRPFIERQCLPTLQPTDVLVKITPKSKNRREQFLDALGCVVLHNNTTGLWINVFYSPIEFEARQDGSAPAVLLGIVITHEIGHFFGLQHHRLYGIMLSRFGFEEMRRGSWGALIFDKTEAECLRTAIAATRLRELETAK
jgi:hypothetical protein